MPLCMHEKTPADNSHMVLWMRRVLQQALVFQFSTTWVFFSDSCAFKEYSSMFPVLFGWWEGNQMFIVLSLGSIFGHS